MFYTFGFQTSNGTLDAGFAKLSHLHHRYCFIEKKIHFCPIKLLIRYQLVDYLTNTGIYEFVLIGRNPREVPSLRTIRLTFDDITWILVIISDVSVTLMLFSIDLIWNWVNKYKTTKMTIRKHGHHGGRVE